MKGHSDLSLGNVVGANVFNLVLVSGMSVTLAPFEIPQSATLFGINSSLVLELPVMLLVMALLIIAFFNYYYAIARNESFKRRFTEMAVLSFSVAGISFLIGYLLKTVTGVGG